MMYFKANTNVFFTNNLQASLTKPCIYGKLQFRGASLHHFLICINPLVNTETMQTARTSVCQRVQSILSEFSLCLLEETCMSLNETN